jgi:hypothetical protein
MLDTRIPVPARIAVALAVAALTASGIMTIASAASAAPKPVSFTVTPKVKTQYELVFAGDSTHKGSASDVVTLRPVR